MGVTDFPRKIYVMSNSYSFDLNVILFVCREAQYMIRHGETAFDVAFWDLVSWLLDDF